MRVRATRKPGVTAFSLVEVVLALGICSVALLAILGLFTVGVQTSKESEDQLHAANMASLILSMRLSAPTSNIPNAAIPLQAMTNAYGNAYSSGTSYVGFDGKLTNVTSAAYLINCRAGTNLITGPNIAQVYLMLSWPPRANQTNAVVGHYEVITQIPLR